MNATVARIVELLFEDYEMTAEVQTIKDEVMTNCQERYEDCVCRGLTEDEAISAVVDSLKGMEDVLKDYPRKDSAHQPAIAFSLDKEGEADVPGDLVFPASSVRSVNANLMYEDIVLEPSPDDMVHVKLEDCTQVHVVLLDDCLQIIHESAMEKDAEPSPMQLDIEAERDPEDGGFTITFNGKSYPLGSFLSGVYDVVKKNLGKNMRVFNVSLSDTAKITVQLPAGHLVTAELHTTSGDIDVSQVLISDALCKTMSGDLSLSVPRSQRLACARLHTTSGDIDADLCAGSVEAVSVSGDVELSADSSDITARTTSGDMELNLTCPSVNLTTVSGDIDLQGSTPMLNACSTSGDMRIESDVRELNVNTTSGDIIVRHRDPNARASYTMNSTSGGLRVRVPVSASVHADLRSLSGKVHNHHADAGDASNVTILMNSLSGGVYVD